MQICTVFSPNYDIKTKYFSDLKIRFVEFEMDTFEMLKFNF